MWKLPADLFEGDDFQAAHDTILENTSSTFPSMLTPSQKSKISVQFLDFYSCIYLDLPLYLRIPGKRWAGGAPTNPFKAIVPSQVAIKPFNKCCLPRQRGQQGHQRSPTTTKNTKKTKAQKHWRRQSVAWRCHEADVIAAADAQQVYWGSLLVLSLVFGAARAQVCLSDVNQPTHQWQIFEWLHPRGPIYTLPTVDKYTVHGWYGFVVCIKYKVSPGNAIFGKNKPGF